MTAPQDDPALIAKLAAMTEAEFDAVITKARGTTSDLSTRIAAAERSGNHTLALTLKTEQLRAITAETQPVYKLT